MRRGGRAATLDWAWGGGYGCLVEPDRVVAWAVPRRGRTCDQVRCELDAVVDEVQETWSVLFPVRKGYLTISQPLRGPVPGMQLDVMRGDFRAALAIYCDLRGTGLVIKAKGEAKSGRVERVECRGRSVVAVGRTFGVIVAVAMVVGACWLAVGTPNPLVGGMLLAILTASLVVGGWNLGGRIGEQLAERRATRERSLASGDLGLQTDFRRWQALRRRVRGQRRRLSRGDDGTPFRRAS